MITVVCVRTGTKFSPDYVARLRAGVDRYLAEPHEFLCITDRPDEVGPGVRAWDVRAFGLEGWWAKMLLFSPYLPAWGRVLYLDLDMVVTGNLAPLASYRGRFGICANFTKRAGHPTWPCLYGSCVMAFQAHTLEPVWRGFDLGRPRWIAEAGKYGDQWVVERLCPNADLLQDILPSGFFSHFKIDLKRGANRPPPAAALVVFSGPAKPHTAAAPWIKEAWAA